MEGVLCFPLTTLNSRESALTVSAFAMKPVFTEQWKQQQAEVIADALHELLAAPDAKPEDAALAIDYAIDSWLDYFDTEREKWEKLKAMVRP